MIALKLYLYNSQNLFSLCYKLKFVIYVFLQPNVVDLRYLKLWIFFARLNKLCWKYQRFTSLGFEGIGIKKFDFVAKS